MRSYPFQLLGLAFLYCCALSALVAEDANASVRVATYNVRNYLSMDRQVEGEFRRDYPKPESEKSVVRETIRQVAPDLLALQEIGDEGHLLELKADLAREGIVFTGYAILEARDPVRRVAALWNNRVQVEVVEHKKLDIKYFGEDDFAKRGMLELAVRDALGRELTRVFILHLKSKYTSDKRDFQSIKRRTLEAQSARDRILQRFPEPSKTRFLVAGDLNDTPNSGAIQRFLKKGKLKISQIVDCRDAHGLIWTHFYVRGGSYSQVDYFLASPAWEGVDLQGSILSRDDYYTGSDHRIVWVDIPMEN